MREKPWTEVLDGTDENGRWCLVWDDEQDTKRIEKIIKTLDQEYRFMDMNQIYWNYAEPVPENTHNALNELDLEVK